MSTPEQLAHQFQQAIEAGNTSALRRLTEALARSLPALVAQAETAAARVASLKAEGKDAEAATFAAMRSRAIALQVEAEVRRLVDQLRPELLNGQAQAVEAGLQAAERLTQAVLGLPENIPLGAIGVQWNRAPLAAVQALQGAFGADGPLPGLLNQIAPDTARRVRETLTTGMLAGKGPRVMARTLRQEIGLSAVRAETIARDQVLKAYRAASVESYAQNSNVVKGFTRRCAKSVRSCIACLVADGQFYKVDETLEEHVQGRCALIPVTKTFRELGIDIEEPPRTEPQSGADWFKTQPEDKQRQILGPGGLAAYQSGVALDRFVKRVDSVEWGPSLQVRPVKELVA